MEKSSSGSIDEKSSMKEDVKEEIPFETALPLSEKLVLDGMDVGDVYEKVRAIDLGSDGKERPIGVSSRCFVEPSEAESELGRNLGRLGSSSYFP